MTTQVKVSKLLLMVALNATVFLLIAFWLQRNITEKVVLQDMHLVSPASILFSVVFGMILIVLYAHRLACLLQTTPVVAGEITCLGFGMNNLLPFRLGDVIRLLLARRFYAIPVPKLIAVAVVEKFFDLFSVFLIGAFLTLSGKFMVKYHILLAALVCLMFIACFLSCKYLLKDTDCFIKPINKVTGYTLLIWLVGFCSFYCFFKINLFSFHFGMLDALVLLFVTTLSLGLPSAPAGIGVFESAIVFYLAQHNAVNNNMAVTVALMFHFSMVVPQIILMILTLLVNGRTLLGWKR